MGLETYYADYTVDGLMNFLPKLDECIEMLRESTKCFHDEEEKTIEAFFEASAKGALVALLAAKLHFDVPL